MRKPEDATIGYCLVRRIISEGTEVRLGRSLLDKTRLGTAAGPILLRGNVVYLHSGQISVSFFNGVNN